MATDAGTIERAMEKIQRNVRKARSGNQTGTESVASVFAALGPELLNQLALALEQYADDTSVICEHCQSSLNLAKDVCGIERGDV